MKSPLARVIFAGLLTVVSWPVAAETLAYQSIGEFGETVFSDIEHPSSETIVLHQSKAESLSSDELIYQMLSVAQSLEQARLTREAQREALARSQQANAPVAQQQPAQPAVERYPLFYPQPRRPGRGHKTDAPVEPTPPAKTFRFKPDL